LVVTVVSAAALYAAPASMLKASATVNEDVARKKVTREDGERIDG
jgi:hypothetical protein